ncbi:MAG: hypothetical protein AB2598_11900 [Candidatus Thiodiazotropha sp.]
MPTATELILLGSAWILYFLLHSLLASLRAKRFFTRYLPRLMPWYRLLFNLIALILLIPPLILVWLYRADPLWQWQGGMAWLAYALMLASLLGFVWSMRYYDSREFLGLRQLQTGQRHGDDMDRLCISPLHRFVRHPWYSLGLVLIWTQDMDPARLLSALIVTAYLVLGSRLEETKLLHRHGDAYAYYRERVPGLIPRPWRYLNRSDVGRILGHLG